ncbi:unnamed protein product [Acanthosepion pharaonis]|uniref:Uncharacterized protein n=1 Tax=Acanthosepion pharaonis TaxID=158019 RepID=A0A812E833_ACAPH|nr:unnamed protein product [Sepia pharaonis]
MSLSHFFFLFLFFLPHSPPPWFSYPFFFQSCSTLSSTTVNFLSQIHLRLDSPFLLFFLPLTYSSHYRRSQPSSSPGVTFLFFPPSPFPPLLFSCRSFSLSLLLVITPSLIPILFFILILPFIIFYHSTSPSSAGHFWFFLPTSPIFHSFSSLSASILIQSTLLNPHSVTVNSSYFLIIVVVSLSSYHSASESSLFGLSFFLHFYPLSPLFILSWSLFFLLHPSLFSHSITFSIPIAPLFLIIPLTLNISFFLFSSSFYLPNFIILHQHHPSLFSLSSSSSSFFIFTVSPLLHPKPPTGNSYSFLFSSSFYLPTFTVLHQLHPLLILHFSSNSSFIFTISTLLHTHSFSVGCPLCSHCLPSRATYTPLFLLLTVYYFYHSPPPSFLVVFPHFSSVDFFYFFFHLSPFSFFFFLHFLLPSEGHFILFLH